MVVARSAATLRVLETSHPPTYYLPRSAFADGVLRPVAGTSYCEWKGQAPTSTSSQATGPPSAPPGPTRTRRPASRTLLDHLAVMPAAVDACFVDGERVVPQQGGFYGGWVTSRVVGPFKGGPGSWGW